MSRNSSDEKLEILKQAHLADSEAQPSHDWQTNLMRNIRALPREKEVEQNGLNAFYFVWGFSAAVIVFCIAIQIYTIGGDSGSELDESTISLLEPDFFSLSEL